MALHRGRVVLRDLTLTKPDGTRLLSVPEVDVLLRGHGLPVTASAFRDIAEIRLRRPKAHVIRERSGRLDIATYWPHAEKGAPPFKGQITVEDGTLTFVDNAVGGLTTTIQQVSMTYQAGAAGVGNFTVTGRESKHAWASLYVQGEYQPAARRIRLTGQIRGLSLARAERWISLPSGLRVSAGQARRGRGGDANPRRGPADQDRAELAGADARHDGHLLLAERAHHRRGGVRCWWPERTFGCERCPACCSAYR